MLRRPDDGSVRLMGLDPLVFTLPETLPGQQAPSAPSLANLAQVSRVERSNGSLIVYGHGDRFVSSVSSPCAPKRIT